VEKQKPERESERKRPYKKTRVTEGETETNRQMVRICSGEIRETANVWIIIWRGSVYGIDRERREERERERTKYIICIARETERERERREREREKRERERGEREREGERERTSQVNTELRERERGNEWE